MVQGHTAAWWAPDVSTGPSPSLPALESHGLRRGVLTYVKREPKGLWAALGCRQEVLHSLPEAAAAFGVIHGGPAGRGVVAVPGVRGRVPGPGPVPTVIAPSMSKL